MNKLSISEPSLQLNQILDKLVASHPNGITTRQHRRYSRFGSNRLIESINIKLTHSEIDCILEACQRSPHIFSRLLNKSLVYQALMADRTEAALLRQRKADQILVNTNWFDKLIKATRILEAKALSKIELEKAKVIRKAERLKRKEDNAKSKLLLAQEKAHKAKTRKAIWAKLKLSREQRSLLRQLGK